MAKNVRDRIQDFFLGNAGVRRVADDPQITAELVMLLRVAVVDGRVKDSEIKSFQKICEKAFGISAEDFPEVLSYLEDFGFEISGEQALGMFKDYDDERKRILMKHMMEIARADDELHNHERIMLQRAATFLGMTGDQWSSN